jgi:hypothetical protein
MSKYSLCILICILSFAFVWAEEQPVGNRPKLGPGMDTKKVGNINVIIPADADVHFEGNRLVVESTSEYVARKFKSFESRLTALEVKLQELEKALDNLTKSIERLVAYTPAAELFKTSSEKR